MASSFGGGGTRGGGNNRDITVLNGDNTIQRVISSQVSNSGGASPAPTLTQAAGGWGYPSGGSGGGSGQPSLGGSAAPQGLQIVPGVNANGVTDAQGRPTGQGANSNYTGRAFSPASGGGGSGVGPAWVNNGTMSYIPGGSNPVALPHWVQMGKDGKPVVHGFGNNNAQDIAERRAAERGAVTGAGMMAEALGLQKNLEAFMELSSQIRKLGIDDKLVKQATNNLMAMFDNNTKNDNWLKNSAFTSNVDFVNEQMARRLSPHGYAPGEHSYGDNTIAQATGAMAMDWTQFWQKANMDVVTQGNQLGMVGAQGQTRAGELAVSLNPAGLYAGGGVAEAVASINPSETWARWQKNQNGWMDNFKFPGT
jgi:hypothetical protein